METNLARPETVLSRQFEKRNLYSNFGAALLKLKVSGFRGVQDFRMTIDYPITAISGTNGAGKSTIAQLISCAYKKMSTDVTTKRYYVKDFFNLGMLDPTPFSDEAAVEYTYATSLYGQPAAGIAATQILTVKRSQSEWSGYKRQPERTVSYVGFTLYVPKVERKDFSVYQAKNLILGDNRMPSEEAHRWTQIILGNSYENVDFVNVEHLTKRTEVGRLTRNGSSYSESNMGFGEGRVLYLIDLLEKSPNNSLFVLEEPETSLHPKAQYMLSQYLINVAIRKKHQIILTTHSENLMSGLPPEARKFLLRKGSKVEVIDRISPSHAECFLSGYHKPALIVCVEDNFAREVLGEIIRKERPDLLKIIDIRPIGDAKAVAQAVGILQQDSNVIAIRDADKGEDVVNFLYKLPGSLPPENEVLNCKEVQDYLMEYYQLDIQEFMKINFTEDVNHHDYYKKIAEEVRVGSQSLQTECIRKYVDSLDQQTRGRIITIIEQKL